MIQNPKTVLVEGGLSFPDSVKFNVLEKTSSVRYLVVPRSIDLEKDPDFTQIIGKILPIPVGIEIRLLQSTETLRYAVLPMPPNRINMESAYLRDCSKLAVTDFSTSNSTSVIVNNRVIAID